MVEESRPSYELLASRWYVPFARVSAVLLIVGFLASAAADRLIFIAWAFLAAFAYGLALRWHWPYPRASAARLVEILSLVSFCWLAVRHAAALKLGAAALLPAIGGAS